MGKCIKLTCNTANGDCWDAKTGDTYFKILDSDFTREERKEHIKRLVSCWNACTQFENPEQDIKKLIEALKVASCRINNEIRHHPEAGDYRQMLQDELRQVDEALDLVKE
jgi:galactokinase